MSDALPQELVDLTLEFVPPRPESLHPTRSDLLACALVSRAWCQTARRLQFHSTSVDEIYGFLAIVSDPLCTFAGYCKKFTWNGGSSLPSEDGTYAGAILHALSQLPNIRHVVIRGAILQFTMEELSGILAHGKIELEKLELIKIFVMKSGHMRNSHPLNAFVDFLRYFRTIRALRLASIGAMVPSWMARPMELDDVHVALLAPLQEPLCIPTSLRIREMDVEVGISSLDMRGIMERSLRKHAIETLCLRAPSTGAAQKIINAANQNLRTLKMMYCPGVFGSGWRRIEEETLNLSQCAELSRVEIEAALTEESSDEPPDIRIRYVRNLLSTLPTNVREVDITRLELAVDKRESEAQDEDSPPSVEFHHAERDCFADMDSMLVREHIKSLTINITLVYRCTNVPNMTEEKEIVRRSFPLVNRKRPSALRVRCIHDNIWKSGYVGAEDV